MSLSDRCMHNTWLSVETCMHGLSPIGTLPLDFIILHQQSAVKRTSGTHDGDTASSMDSPELEVEG